MENSGKDIVFKRKRDGSDTCLLLISDNSGYLVLIVRVFEDVLLEYILHEAGFICSGTVELLETPKYDGIDAVVHIQHMLHDVMNEEPKTVKFNKRSEDVSEDEEETENQEVVTEVQEVITRRVLITSFFGLILTEDYESLAIKKPLTTEIVVFMLNNMNEAYCNDKFCIIDPFIVNYAIDHNNQILVEELKSRMDRLKERFFVKFKFLRNRFLQAFKN